MNLSKTGVDGIVIFNRYYSPDINIDTKKLTVANIFSSPSDIRIPLRWIALTSDKEECSLAATTGIYEGKDLVKMILAGASAVEIISTIYKNGSSQIRKMNDFLTDYLINNNYYKSLNDFKGLANHKNVDKPGMYERVQFMRYFSVSEKDII